MLSLLDTPMTGVPGHARVNPESAADLAYWADVLHVTIHSLRAAIYAIGSCRIADLNHWFHLPHAA